MVIGNSAPEHSLYLGRVIDMVHVSMRNQQKVEFCSEVTNPFGRSGWGIKQNVASVRQNKISVGVEDTANKRLNLEHSE